MKARTIAALFMLGLLIGPASAQETYPSRPITMIVPIAAGGGLDAVARAVGRRLSAALHQTVVVDNRPGGSQNIGIRTVAKAAPDGYTLLYASNTIAINPAMFSNLGYDANTDLAPIGKVASLPLIIVSGLSAPYKTLSDLIAYAKASPDKVSYGSPGTGTPHHLGMELLKSAAGIDIQHIPYKGAAPGLTDLLGGNLPLLVTTAAAVRQQVESGQIRALVTLDLNRLRDFPAVPSVNETLPGFEVPVWHALFAPAATPPAILGRLTKVLEGVLKDPELATQLDRIGVQTAWLPPVQFRAAMQAEQSQWAAAIKRAGIKAR